MYKAGTKPSTTTASSVRPTTKTLASGTGVTTSNKENGKNNKEETMVCSLSALKFCILSHCSICRLILPHITSATFISHYDI